MHALRLTSPVHLSRTDSLKRKSSSTVSFFELPPFGHGDQRNIRLDALRLDQICSTVSCCEKRKHLIAEAAYRPKRITTVDVYRAKGICIRQSLQG